MFLEQLISKASEDESVTDNHRQLFKSLCVQVYRKSRALTDNQLELALTKLKTYSKYKDASELPLEFPIRFIDRSRYVKFTQDKIIVRFVFNKKLINFIELAKQWLVSKNKIDNTYTYKFTDQSCFEIVNILQHHNFEIAPELTQRCVELQKIKNDPTSYVPGLYNYEIKNLPLDAVNFYTSKYGAPSNENLQMYIDRKQRIGLEIIDTTFNSNDKYLEKIVNRKSRFVYISPSDSIKEIAKTLNKLNRDKILFVHDYNFFDDLTDEAFKIRDELETTYTGEITMQLNLEQDTKTETIFALYPRTKGWFRKFPLSDLIICYNNSGFPLLETIE